MKTSFSAIQWLGFMIAGSIVAPIAIAELYHLSPVEASGLVQRTMFIIGISSLLQALIGHKLPINEGPAGLWWGVFVLYAGLGTTLFSDSRETLQALEGAMMISGLVFILISMFQLIEKLSRLFTPVVTGIYLVLLIAQLSGSFLKGMLGLGNGAKEDPSIAIFSFGLVTMTFYLSKHRYKWVSQYSILISLTIGWILFALMDFGKALNSFHGPVIAGPELFSFGKPIFNEGLMVTAVFITFLLLANMLASIRITSQVLKDTGSSTIELRYGASGYTSGINQILAGIFSAIGSVPISGAAGFIATTRITSLLPFIVSSFILMAASFFPGAMSFLASLPAPVGYSVTFAIFANMIGMALSEIEREPDKQRVKTVTGISLMLGIGLMFVPGEAFREIPVFLASFLNNGLILGTISAVIIDQFTLRKRIKI